MGCMFGREVSSRDVTGSKQGSNSAVKPGEKSDSVANLDKNSRVEVQHEESEKEKVEDGKKLQERRRRSRTNSRLTNLPKHILGEQVAAGWPSWLSDICGEALSRWIPRKANTFEKIDKAETRFTQRGLAVLSVFQVQVLRNGIQWAWLPFCELYL